MDSAHPPPFSEHLRRAGTSHTMNHIITRVVLAFPTTQSDFPNDLLTAQGRSPFTSPCLLGVSHPKLHHTPKVKEEGTHQIIIPQHLNPDTPPAGLLNTGSVLSLEISASSWLQDKS